MTTQTANRRNAREYGAKYYEEKRKRHYSVGQIALGNQCHRQAAKLRHEGKDFYSR